MPSPRNPAPPARGIGLTEFFWNVVGGALVSAMIAGTIYVLAGMVGQFFYDNTQFWNIQYLKIYFGVTLFIYIVMPVTLANTVGFIFGAKSKASGKKKNV